MSEPERRLIESYLADQSRKVPLAFSALNGGFVSLQAAPCPLYDQQNRSCSVYAVRPYNCRRFVCLRPDVKAEPFEASGANMMDRVKSSGIASHIAKKYQRKAQRWARSTIA